MSGFGFRVPVFGFQVSGFGFRVPGTGSRVYAWDLPIVLDVEK